MEMDVNPYAKVNGAIELMTISAGSYNSSNNSIHNNNGSLSSAASAAVAAATASTPSSPQRPRGTIAGCCGILSRLLCYSRNTGKTSSSSCDYNNFSFNPAPASSALVAHSMSSVPPAYAALQRKLQHRRTPQEIYFESRGKSCKKLLKFNGNCNKILLYPEEGWARTASSSYWTITPCWWQPNRCRIEEFSGTQRHATKAKMVPLEQKGSLLIAGHFRRNNNQKKNGINGTNHQSSCNSSSHNHNDFRTGDTTTTTTTGSKDKDADEFKLYLSSNISMEDYNMGYCLTGFVERRCHQSNTFQMTHFAVIKRQWPSISQNDTKST